MSIHFIKFKGNKVIYNDGMSHSDEIIKACFKYCKILVRKKVEKFIEDKEQRHLLLNFSEYKVRLEKRKTNLILLLFK